MKKIPQLRDKPICCGKPAAPKLLEWRHSSVRYFDCRVCGGHMIPWSSSPQEIEQYRLQCIENDQVRTNGLCFDLLLETDRWFRRTAWMIKRRIIPDILIKLWQD